MNIYVFHRVERDRYDDYDSSSVIEYANTSLENVQRFAQDLGLAGTVVCLTINPDGSVTQKHVQTVF